VHFTCKLMIEQDAHAIATWQYQKPSPFYNADQDPDDLAELLNPHSWQETYHSVLDEQKELIGFIPFNEDEGIIEIWLGLRPDLTGKGIGLAFVQAGLSCAKNTDSCTTLRLKVATFNQRTIRVYEYAGFHPVCVFMHTTHGGEYACLEMTMPCDSQPTCSSPSSTSVKSGQDQRNIFLIVLFACP
jgi:[ribosomal protein S18]-alanine N-acetyltransferase